MSFALLVNGHIHANEATISDQLRTFVTKSHWRLVVQQHFEYV